MATLKMIVYPFGAAILGMILAVLVGMSVFGVTEWHEVQNRIVGALGTIAGLTGAITGLYWAIRSEEHSPR